MGTLGLLWHQFVLRHKAAWIQLDRRLPTHERWKRWQRGALLECPSCGRRWIGRAPWFTHGG